MGRTLVVVAALFVALAAGVMVPNAGSQQQQGGADDAAKRSHDATMGPVYATRPKLDELFAQLKELKEPAPVEHMKLEHVEINKPTDADKKASPEARLSHLMDMIKAFQAQHLVLGAAIHAVNERLQMETDQTLDQQSILAKSFEALFRNVASRQDMEEIITAAGEDNAIHTDLDDTSRKLEEMMTHIRDIKGGDHVTDGASMEAEWKHLTGTIAETGLDKELENMKAFVSTLKRYRHQENNSLFYFVLLNVSLVLCLLLWWSRAKSHLHYR